MKKYLFITMMILSLLFPPVVNVTTTVVAGAPITPPGNPNDTGLPDEQQYDTATWPMLAANPERTSWTSTEVKGNLKLAWYRPIEPYIPYKVQPIAANGKIYVSTARGLYAFNAANGDLAWVYATALPLGHSPTIATVNGKTVAFVGGYDRVIHAIDDSTGKDLAGYSPYVAGAGFETNPLVINNTIYAGNRDGYFYALNAATGGLIRRYKTDGPILYSAAYKNGVVYFASNDSYAYALNAGNFNLIWKSAKLPTSGFHSFWPVIYTDKSTGKDYAVFSGGENYRFSARNLVNDEAEVVYKDNGIGDDQLIGATSTSIPGDWVAGTTVVNAHILTDYFETRPYRRTIFVLNAATGQEFTFDSDGDGKKEYAPFNWSGVTHSGNKFPPLVNGKDGVYYQGTGYIGDSWISRSGPVGWKFGTQYISRVSSVNFASDEPVAYASGGNLIYFALCCDRQAGVVDVSIPYGQSNREWFLYNYNLANNSLAPGYQQMYNSGDADDYNNVDGWQVYSGKNQSKNGIYGKHGTTQSPPIPYQGRVYMLKGNSLLAFSAAGTNPKTPLPVATTQAKQNMVAQPGSAEIAQRLETEVQKMIAAGPIRPGYYDAGFADAYGMRGYSSVDVSFGKLFDYFQHPADTVYTLLLAYPYLSAGTQQSVKTYLQTYYAPGKTYDFTKYAHIGWTAGATREERIIPEDIWDDWRPSYNPSTDAEYPPFFFYAAWQYAKIVGNNSPAFAKNLFDPIRNSLHAPLSNDTFTQKPYWLNQYIAGYKGYLELQKLAGYTQDSTVSSRYQAMLNLRVNAFSKDTPYAPIGGNGDWRQSYNNTLAIARNFMFLTPELGAYLRQNALTKIQTALIEYESVGSYWFVAGFDDTYGEGTLQPLYDSPALFQAKAWILNEPYNNLVQWIDVPYFYRGDLFYIQNLATLLSNPSTPAPKADFTLSVSPDQRTVEAGQKTTYAVQIDPTGGYTGTVNLSAGGSPAGLNVKLSSAANLRPPVTATLTVTDTSSAARNYLVTVIAQDTKNTSLRYTSTVNLQVRAVSHAHYVYLPMVSRR